jgi:hypothetical protein
MPQPLIRINNLLQRRPRMPGLSTWLATTRTRNDFGAGLLNSESDDGGFDEFREFCPNRAVNSATCASSCPIRSACTATRTASSS